MVSIWYKNIWSDRLCLSLFAWELLYRSTSRLYPRSGALEYVLSCSSIRCGRWTAWCRRWYWCCSTWRPSPQTTQPLIDSMHQGLSCSFHSVSKIKIATLRFVFFLFGVFGVYRFNNKPFFFKFQQQ